jgi:hypothetical protein
MLRTRRTLVIATSAAIMAMVGCGSSTDPQEECSELIEGMWQGQVGDDTFTLFVSPLRGFGVCSSHPFVGQWRFRGQVGEARGSFRSLTTVQADLVPLTSACNIGEGPGLTLSGTLQAESLVVVIGGGWRELPASNDCADPSDTIIAIDPTEVTLVRGG